MCGRRRGINGRGAEGGGSGDLAALGGADLDGNDKIIEGIRIWDLKPGWYVVSGNWGMMAKGMMN